MHSHSESWDWPTHYINTSQLALACFLRTRLDLTSTKLQWQNAHLLWNLGFRVGCCKHRFKHFKIFLLTPNFNDNWFQHMEISDIHLGTLDAQFEIWLSKQYIYICKDGRMESTSNNGQAPQKIRCAKLAREVSHFSSTSVLPREVALQKNFCCLKHFTHSNIVFHLFTPTI